MPDLPNYQDVTELARTDSEEKANGYLKLGWVLLNVESLQHSEHGWTSVYILGWKNSRDEIQYPELTEWEKMAESVEKDESIPF